MSWMKNPSRNGTDRRKHWKGHTAHRPKASGGHRQTEAGTKEHRGDVVFVEKTKEQSSLATRATDKQGCRRDGERLRKAASASSHLRWQGGNFIWGSVTVVEPRLRPWIPGGEGGGSKDSAAGEAPCRRASHAAAAGGRTQQRSRASW